MSKILSKKLDRKHKIIVITEESNSRFYNKKKITKKKKETLARGMTYEMRVVNLRKSKNNIS